MNFLRNFYKAPEDNDPEFIRMVRNILIFVLIGDTLLIATVSGFFIESARSDFSADVLAALWVISAVALLLAYRRRIRMAKVVTPLTIIAAVTLIAINADGLHDISLLGLGFAVVMGALLLGQSSLYVVAPLAILSVTLLAAADFMGYTSSPLARSAALGDAIIASVIILATSATLQLLMQRLRANVEKARQNEEAQIEANRRLQKLQESLETVVAQRTAEVETANQYNQRRAQQFEAIAQVARVATTIQNPDILLPRITELISQYFGYYHVGIFLLDDNHEYAILRAANSPGGKKMLEREHKLKVGQTGIVGYAAGTGAPRIALETGADAVYFDNPDLPDTHSEIALPLLIGGEVIGVLDVQSAEANAFLQEDLQILSTLADQVSAAIQNARSFQEAQKLLNEAQSTVGGFIMDAWQALHPTYKGPGYQFTAGTMKPLEKPLEGPHISEALKKGKVIPSEGTPHMLAVPIRLRDQIIGVMELQNPNNEPWDDDQIDIVSAVADRLSTSIEIATLLEATRRRASLERITADISNRISSSTHFATILQTAAEELSRAFGDSDVLVQIEPASLKLTSAM